MEYSTLDYDFNGSFSTTTDLYNQNTRVLSSSDQATTNGVYDSMEWLVSVDIFYLDAQQKSYAR